MNLQEALNDQPEYAVKYKDLTLYFTLRNPTNSEDLEYRRRSAKVQLKGKKLESGDDALNAPLWLLDKIKTKVEYSNGSAERLPVSEEDYRAMPARTKLAIISRHLAELEGEEAEISKN